MEAVAVLNNEHVQGTVVFRQVPRKGVEISVDIKGGSGLKPGEHGLHIHRSGDLRRGCDSCCSHYNPSNKTHGGLESEESHAGDLGNITIDGEGRCAVKFITKKFKVKDVIGRSLIIHQDRDDLGKGRNKDSKLTGNAGPRLACAVIGISEASC